MVIKFLINGKKSNLEEDEDEQIANKIKIYGKQFLLSHFIDFFF